MSHDYYRVKTHGAFVASRIATVSSPVARQAHNLKVVSSNLAPATKFKPRKPQIFRGFCLSLHLFHGFLLLPAICPR